MSDEPFTPQRPEPGGPSLREALRRARTEAADRADGVIDLRHAERARLELLHDALRPVFEQVPEGVDLFDPGLVAGERPRLFVDMVAFVEMDRDRRTYNFWRDGRSGRVALAASVELQPMVDAVTSYVARRLVERERLLADEVAPPVTGAPAPPAERASGSELVETSEISPGQQAKPRRSPFWMRALALLVAFGVGGGVGAALIVGLMVAASKGIIPWIH